MISPAAAKGLEFDAIVVVDPETIERAGPEGLRMLYIALTRTTRELTVVYPAGTLPALLQGSWAPEEGIQGGAGAAGHAHEAQNGNEVNRMAPGAGVPAGPLAGPRVATVVVEGKSALMPAQARVVEAQADELLGLLDDTTPRRLWRHVLQEALAKLDKMGAE